ncbi:putative type III effector protein [Xanthomonas translucens pv. poae]|uniref:Putative type III effector protein n=2 Tax=Xanthomonas translucens group TaxID=3390202 RepID=A0A0K3A0P1_9XANT|nr:XopG/HopH/AvrPtoH family type III secretion system effector [Xanthomonas translucens]UKE63152.1 type III secretion system effector protein [Xanthomonas translucens pv. poae]CTP91498.1 putative type III effector protein [Xanthomonas translucens pv. poae]
MTIPTKYRGIYSQSFHDNQRDEARFNAEVTTHLDNLGSQPSGNQLLDELTALSNQRSHKLTIREKPLSRRGPMAEPVLSGHQLQRHPDLESYEEIREVAGSHYALEKDNRPNVGSSVVVSWSAHQTSMGLDRDGYPTCPTASNNDKVSLLAHELVHAKHMMAGTWKGSYEDRNDASTASGQEELRAVGMGRYAYSLTGAPSENSVRAEHGLPLRHSYCKRG